MAMSNRALRLTEQRLRLRHQLWPEVTDNQIWNRKQRNGFITVPRTMPLVLALVDSLAVSKPLSATYLALWCRTFDEGIVVVTNPIVLAFESGFGGQRGVQTWNQRMRMLRELGLIATKEGAAGPYSHVLIFNPYHVIRQLKEKGANFPEDLYNAFLSRAMEVGADDMDTANSPQQEGHLAPTEHGKEAAAESAL